MEAGFFRPRASGRSPTSWLVRFLSLLVQCHGTVRAQGRGGRGRGGRGGGGGADFRLISWTRPSPPHNASLRLFKSSVDVQPFTCAELTGDRLLITVVGKVFLPRCLKMAQRSFSGCFSDTEFGISVKPSLSTLFQQISYCLSILKTELSN